MGLIYDPPSGWRYGFPKPYRPLEGETLEDTLVRDGYPRVMAEDFGAKHCRFIGERDELGAMAQHHVEGDNDNQTPAEMLAAAVADAPVAAQAQPARIEDDPAYQEFERLANEQGVNHASPTAPAVWHDRSPIATLRNAGGFIYLGSPYSLYPDHDEAAEIVAAAAAGLMAQGLVVYSPIAHGHYVSQQGNLPTSWEFWKAQCQPLIDAASALAVLKMEGWGKSVGLQYEIGEFRRAGKPVVFLDSEAGVARANGPR